MLWLEFTRAYNATTAGDSAYANSDPDKMTAAEWAAITECYAGPEFDRVEGCDGINRHRVFTDWVVYGAGREVLKKYLLAQNEMRAKLHRQAADLRAHAYLLDTKAES